MLKLFIAHLANEENARTEVPLDRERFLSVTVETDAGTFQLTETVDGSLHISAPDGCLTLQPCNANSLDARVQKFGRAGRPRFREESEPPK